MPDELYYKKCPRCQMQWRTRQDFLADKTIKLNGYQVSFKNIEAGLLLFTHMLDECRTTMGVPVSEFLDFYRGERFTENKALSPECPRYCIDKNRLDRCSARCECAFVREIIQHVVTFNGQPLPETLL